MPSLLEKHGVPGVAVGLVHQGDVAGSQGYGASDLASGALVDKDTVFHLASLATPVTAWGVMRLGVLYGAGLRALRSGGISGCAWCTARARPAQPAESG